VSDGDADKRARGAGLTPEQRRQRDFQVGRHAQAELRARLEREVDPEGTLSPEERARRVQAALDLAAAYVAYQDAKGDFLSRTRRKADGDPAGSAPLSIVNAPEPIQVVVG